MDTDEEPLPGPPPPPLAGYTGYLLRRAFVRARPYGVRAMPTGRRPQELGVLATVDAVGPVSQRRLGEMLDINRSVMVKLADRLEADGLLERERDPADRRNYALSTTAAGNAAIVEMMAGAIKGEAELTAGLTRPERDRLIELLRRTVPDLVGLVPEELGGNIGYLIVRAHLRLRGEGARLLARLDIAPQHFGMLVTLDDIEPCSQRRLATALGVSGPAVAAVVGDLAERGLISRERNPADRREHLLRLTREGHAKRTAAVAIIEGVHDRLARKIGAAEVTELNALLTKIIT